MNQAGDGNKQRNLQIARNEERKQVTGSVRLSTWAMAAAVVIGVLLFALGWIAYRL